MGRWALHKCIEDYLRWRRAGLAAVRIAGERRRCSCGRGFIAEIKQAIGIDALAATDSERAHRKA